MRSCLIMFIVAILIVTDVLGASKGLLGPGLECDRPGCEEYFTDRPLHMKKHDDQDQHDFGTSPECEAQDEGPRPPSRGSSVRRVGPPRGSISGPSNPKRPRAGPRPPSRGSSVHSASQGSSVRSVSPPGGSIFGPSNPERPRTGPRPPSRGSSVHSARQGSSVRSVSPPGGSISGSSNPERQREARKRRRRKNSQGQYTCDKCSQNCSTATALRVHKDRHVPGGWPCKRNCGHAPFRDRYARNNHEHTTCSENKHPQYPCSICEKPFASPWKLERHEKFCLKESHSNSLYPMDSEGSGRPS